VNKAKVNKVVATMMKKVRCFLGFTLKAREDYL